MRKPIQIRYEQARDAVRAKAKELQDVIQNDEIQVPPVVDSCVVM
jgi:hypothetical protein